MNTFDRKLSVEILGHQFELTVPTVRQMIQIENLKLLYSGSMYRALVKNDSVTSSAALDAIDAAAYFEVLCPDLAKELSVKIIDLDVMDAKPILDVFKTTVAPWISQWQTEMSAPLKK